MILIYHLKLMIFDLFLENQDILTKLLFLHHPMIWLLQFFSSLLKLLSKNKGFLLHQDIQHLFTRQHGIQTIYKKISCNVESSFNFRQKLATYIPITQVQIYKQTKPKTAATPYPLVLQSQMVQIFQPEKFPVRVSQPSL